jgi:hypothetical protein
LHICTALFSWTDTFAHLPHDILMDGHFCTFAPRYSRGRTFLHFVTNCFIRVFWWVGFRFRMNKSICKIVELYLVKIEEKLREIVVHFLKFKWGSEKPDFQVKEFDIEDISKLTTLPLSFVALLPPFTNLEKLKEIKNILLHFLNSTLIKWTWKLQFPKWCSSSC